MLLETTPFEDLWSEAVAGEQIVERYLAHEKPAEHSPIAVMQLLLVQTWKPITPDQENPVVGWVLGTLFPGFRCARPTNQAAGHARGDRFTSDRIPTGVALAGLARVAADPEVLRDLRSATLLRGQRNFDRFCREANFETPLAHRLSHQERKKHGQLIFSHRRPNAKNISYSHSNTGLTSVERFTAVDDVGLLSTRLRFTVKSRAA